MIDFSDHRIQQFGYLELRARQVVEGFITGLHKSPFHGFSVEFSEHRQYNTGESTRNIDWKLYARTDKLFVKRFEEETNLRCQLVIDGSPSMLFPERADGEEELRSKFAFSIFSAAVFLVLLRQQRDSAGLSIISSTLDVHTPARSTIAHHQYLMGLLENHYKNLKPSKNTFTDLATNLHLIAEQIHRRSLVIILSDLLDSSHKPEALFDALQHLKHNKHDVIIFHVLDNAHEVDFEYDNKPYRFVDIENGSELKIRPAEIKAEYKRRFESFRELMRINAVQYGVDFCEADIRNGLNGVLLPFFARRRSFL